MSKLTAAALLALVTFAILIERDSRADRAHIEKQVSHILPVQPEVSIAPPEPAPPPPPPGPVVPPDCYDLGDVHMPFVLDGDLR